MKSDSFVAVDFETATNSRMACQVGIVVVEHGVIKEKVSRLIQPPGNIYDESTINIHHITPEVTAECPTFDKVWEDIQHYFIGTNIIAHNAEFDESVLRINLEYYNIMPMGILPFDCTCNMYGRTGLHDLCIAFGMDFSRHHEALFDAECCAQFYLNYLNGVKPDFSRLGEKGTVKENKYKRYADRQISGDVLKKDLSNADPNNPFYDRKIVITGEFSQDRKFIAKQLKEMGADVDTTITKRTNYVLIGIDAGPVKLEKLEKLIHDGYNIRKLYQHDIDAILAGDWEGYHADKTVQKALVLTYEHYVKHHLTFDNDYNIIASKELYYGKGFKGNFDLFNQITGNLGAAGDTQIYPETNIIVLSDSSISQLQAGVPDETIKYIQDYYNNNKSIVFDFSFISETDILDFCKRRCEKCGDEVTMELYEKYMESAIKQVTEEKESKYKFKEGKNYCKVDGKIVLKLSDGRTWCPSRQFRGDVYNLKDD